MNRWLSYWVSRPTTAWQRRYIFRHRCEFNTQQVQSLSRSRSSHPEFHATSQKIVCNSTYNLPLKQILISAKDRTVITLYIKLKNVNWQVVEKRLTSLLHPTIKYRFVTEPKVITSVINRGLNRDDRELRSAEALRIYAQAWEQDWNCTEFIRFSFPLDLLF